MSAFVVIATAWQADRKAARSVTRYSVSCTTQMPCRSVIRALGQRATAAR
jgi:hypothetical protein